MSHVGWLVGKLFAGSLEHGVGVPQDGGLQGVLQGGGGPQGVPALVRRGGGSWSVVPHRARAPVVKIFKFRAQALLLGLSLGLDKNRNLNPLQFHIQSGKLFVCKYLGGSTWFPARTLEASNLTGELDTVQALREVLAVHPGHEQF